MSGSGNSRTVRAGHRGVQAPCALVVGAGGELDRAGGLQRREVRQPLVVRRGFDVDGGVAVAIRVPGARMQGGSPAALARRAPPGDLSVGD